MRQVGKAQREKTSESGVRNREVTKIKRVTGKPTREKGKIKERVRRKGRGNHRKLGRCRTEPGDKKKQDGGGDAA